MTLADYCKMRLPGSRWRRDARRVIVGVIEASGDVSPAALLAAIDHAYPFGERRHEPYKCWLAERKLSREALADTVAMPSRDEADACEVARDMVLEGRLDDARAALELAPNRLARKCIACSAMPGRECLNLDAAPMGTSFRACTSEPGGMDEICIRCARHIGTHTGIGRMCESPSSLHPNAERLLVPHRARLVGHRDAGPLFEAR